MGNPHQQPPSQVVGRIVFEPAATDIGTNRNPPSSGGVSPEQSKAIVDALTSVINQWGTRIMSAWDDFVQKQQAFQQTISAGVDGIATDVKSLKDQLAALQAAPGSFTPEQQAAVDQLNAGLESIANRVTALDAETP